ncbi:MAG: mechanosensitive ion channel domain-containing protein [Massilia sp.]
MEFLGVNWIGFNAQNGKKLVLSLIFILLVLVLSSILRWILGQALRRTDRASVQTKFWSRQAVSLLAALVVVAGLLSIWFNDPARMATAFGLITAGLAFALQQVITSIAGYFVILRGATFTVGDRISMGGVRGDVIQLGFIQTTIMEMGQPPTVQTAEPAMWVKSRQFTGRIVTVSNSKIFAEPVFNYTQEFPYIWEEMVIPITYKADREKVESILLEAARKHAVDPHLLEQAAKDAMEDRFGLKTADLEPRVYFRITDNWLELTVRFVVPTHGIRSVKDLISRDLVSAFDQAGIGIASATYDIVGFPSIDIRREQPAQPA